MKGNSGSGVGAGVVAGGGVVVIAGVIGIVGVAVDEGKGVDGVVDSAGVGETTFGVQPLKATIIVIIKIITNTEKAFLPINRWSCVILIFPLTGLNRRTISLWHC